MNALIFITIMFSVIIFHELGHYFVGKYYKLNIDEFSAGIGYALFKKKINNTLFCLRILPIGGYVKSDVNSYNKLSLFKKCIFILGGVSVNLLLVIITMSLFYKEGFIAGFLYSFKFIYLGAHYIFTNISLLDIIKDTSIDKQYFGYKQIITSEPFENYKIILNYFMAINLVVAIFNLLSIPILDGGRILVEIVKTILNKLKVSKNIINNAEIFSYIISAIILFILPNIYALYKYIF